ncbi:MAG: hypothetical protein ACO3FL_04430 [Ilumatobacteraceae bacterium]
MKKTVNITYYIEEYEDEREFKRAMTADALYRALWSIAQEVFRPARKHGYAEANLNEALESDAALLLVTELEKKFYEILRDNDIDLDLWS